MIDEDLWVILWMNVFDDYSEDYQTKVVRAYRKQISNPESEYYLAGEYSDLEIVEHVGRMRYQKLKHSKLLEDYDEYQAGVRSR